MVFEPDPEKAYDPELLAQWDTSRQKVQVILADMNTQMRGKRPIRYEQWRELRKKYDKAVAEENRSFEMLLRKK